MQPDNTDENQVPFLEDSDRKTAAGDEPQKRVFVIGDCGHETVDKLLKKLYDELTPGDDVIINGDFFYPGIDTNNGKNIIRNPEAFNNYMKRFKDLDTHLKETGGQLMFSIGNHERGWGAKFQWCYITYGRAKDRKASDANARELVEQLHEMGFTCFFGEQLHAGLTELDSFHYTTPDKRIFVLDSSVINDSNRQTHDLKEYLRMCGECNLDPIVVSHHPVETTSKYEKKQNKDEHSYPHDAGTGKNHNQLVEQALFDCMTAAGVNSMILLAAHMHTSEHSIRTYKDMTIYCAIEGTGALAEATGPLLFSSGCLALSYNKKDGHITALDRKVAVTETLMERHKIPIFFLLAGAAYLASDLLKKTEMFQQLIEWVTQGKFDNQTVKQEGIVGAVIFVIFSLLLILSSCCLRCCPTSKHEDRDYSEIFPINKGATLRDMESGKISFFSDAMQSTDADRNREAGIREMRTAS